MIYALDTCTVIHLFKGTPEVQQNLRLKEKNNQIAYPPIVYYEILRGFMDNNAEKKIRDFKMLYEKSFIPKISEKELMEKSAELYISLKRKGFTIGNDDIFIGAWCLLAGAILVTDNVKHFQHIDGLAIENWKND
jgi:predicted nucleic acid-binding protein